MFLLALAHAAPLDIDALAAGADEARISATIAVLSGVSPLPDGATLASRAMRHPDHARALTWVSGPAWADAAVAVELQEASVRGYDLTNVIGELPGADPTLSPLILAAHWDSTAASTDGWTERTDPAPGADDDASGVAVVLEAARLLARWEPGYARTVRFILFDGEEVGLLGSEAYVDALVADGEGVELALILDPVGYNPSGASILWASYDAQSADAADALEATGAAVDPGVEVYPADAAAWGGDTRSDHAPFQAAGFVALHGGSFPQPETYHTEGDTPDVVDPAFTTAVARLSVAHLAAAAGPLEGEEPAATGCVVAHGGTGLWIVGVVAVLRRCRGSWGSRSPARRFGQRHRQ